MIEKGRDSVWEKTKIETGRIVDSVLTQGLLNTTDQQKNDIPLFPTCEGKYNVESQYNRIEGGYIDPSSKHPHNRSVREALVSREEMSALPVVVERAHEGYSKCEKLPTEIIEERANRSMMVVVDLDKTPQDEYFGLVSPVSSESFKTVLMPEAIVEELQGKFVEKDLHISVTSVGSKEEILFGKKVEVPDYEGVLTKIVAENSSSIFVHAVRLPTDEDIIEGRVGDKVEE